MKQKIPYACGFHVRNGARGGSQVMVATSAIMVVTDTPSGETGCILTLRSGDTFELVETYAEVCTALSGRSTP